MILNPATYSFLQSLPHGTVSPVTPAYTEEPRGRYQGQGAAVVKPRNTQEVAGILRACHAARVPVVPYAGGTGLVGGQVMTDGPAPVILSLERMNRILSVDAADNTATVEAGVILADLQMAAAGADRLFPLSLASEGSCRIGGNLATNAGGVQVLRYGNTRDLTLGLEAVLADGTVVDRLKPLRKDNTGYDLRNLMIGSEGSLGIITKAVMKLYPRPRQIETVFAAVPSPQAALDLLNHMRDFMGEAVSAFELISAQGLAFMAEHLPDIRQPGLDGAAWMVLMECSAGAGEWLPAQMDSALEAAMSAGLILDAVQARSESQRAELWSVREHIPIGNRKVGAIASHDISVPLSKLPQFIEDGLRAVADVAPDVRINCFGHLGDGNLHYNAFPAMGRTRGEYENLRPAITRAVHDLVHEHGGSVSAEHGIGRLKTDDLARYGDAGALSAMARVKAALDPHGILNPGVIVRA